MMIFWFAVMGLLYVLMTHHLKPKQAQVLANGDLALKAALLALAAIAFSVGVGGSQAAHVNVLGLRAFHNH
jgi:hypothetical protein